MYIKVLELIKHISSIIAWFNLIGEVKITILIWFIHLLEPEHLDE